MSNLPKKFNRPPRILRNFPEGKVYIPKPPETVFKSMTGAKTILLLPMALAWVLCIVTIFLVIFHINFLEVVLNNLFVISILFGVLISSVISIIDKVNSDRSKAADYEELLRQRRFELSKHQIEQQNFLYYLYPPIDQIASWASLPSPPRLWERRLTDEDFLSLRIGLGERSSIIEIEIEKSANETPLYEIAKELGEQFKNLSEVPYTINLNELGFLGVVGEQAQTSSFLRALICHLTAHHSPDEVKVMVSCTTRRAEIWSWVTLLPHANIPTQSTEITLLGSSMQEIEFLTEEVIMAFIKDREVYLTNNVESSSISPHKISLPPIVWFVEDFSLVKDTAVVERIFEIGIKLGFYLVISHSNSQELFNKCNLVVEINNEGVSSCIINNESRLENFFLPDYASVEFCEEFALTISPLRLEGLNTGVVSAEIQNSSSLWMIYENLHGKSNIQDIWRKNQNGTLKVPLGLRVDGSIFYLDLTSPGDGPHGLIAGATGSGKSHLLRTLVCSLAMANHPDNLNFILGDFKGGLVFNDMESLPHVISSVDNLSIPMIERFKLVLESELHYRMVLLRNENVGNIADYKRKKPATPLPYLVIILDEFGELIGLVPDFVDTLTQVARTGRSLGVHLILATQKPSGVVTPRLDSNLNFRLCLRTNSPEDSIAVLGSKDAYLLSRNSAGQAFFKVGNAVFELVQLASVDFQAVNDESDIMNSFAGVVKPRWDLYSLLLVTKLASSYKNFKEEIVNKLDIQKVLEECAEAVRYTKKIYKLWSEPLKDYYYLADYFGNKSFVAHLPAKFPFGYEKSPLALIDNVFERNQELLFLDLLKGESYCITGSPGSGKTTALCTMLTSLAITHHPDKIKIYIIDTHNTLKTFDELPQIARYISYDQHDILLQTLEELHTELNRRRFLFSEKKLPNFSQYQDANNFNEYLPAIFIVFDDFFDYNITAEAEEYLRILIQHGGTFGIIMAITMNQITSLNSEITNYLFQIALRQNYDSLPFHIEKNRFSYREIPPGRGFIKSKKFALEIQILSPYSTNNDQSKELKNLYEAYIKKDG